MPTATASSKLLEPILQLARHYAATRLSEAEPETSAGQTSISLQEQLLDDAGLSHQDFTRPDARFPADRFSRILSRLALASDNPHINLRLAEATQPRMLGSTGFLISTADTLAQALAVLEDYLPILFENAALRLEKHDTHTRLVLTLDDARQNVTEFFLACLLNWPRWLTGQQIPVQEVELAYPEPEDPIRYRQLLAADIQFDARRNSILLPNQYLSLPCTDANREMHQLHKEFADALLGKTHKKIALTAQVRQLIREQILSGGEVIRREEVARELGLSLRTLQRKLGELDTNFQTLYDQTRKDLCFHLIRKGDLSFGEIAFQLGFSNQSAFQKAFKRWAGMPPSQYRQQLKQSETGSTDQTKAPEPFAPRSLALPPLQDEPALQAIPDTIQPADEPLSLKLQKLNPYGLKTLRRAAVYGETFNLNHLAQVSSDPEARLMIHLWPAQQEGLIEPVPGQEEKLEFRFCQPEIRQQICDQLTDQEQQALHRKFGQLLWQMLAPSDAESTPTEISTTGINPVYNNISGQLLDKTLYHLNLAVFPADKPNHTDPAQTIPPDALIRLNQQAARRAYDADKQDQARHYLMAAHRGLTRADSVSSSSLSYQQADLQLLLGETEAAEATINLTMAHLIPEQPKNDLLLLQVKILQLRGKPEQALETLRPNISPEIPSDEKDQLIYLLHALEQIQTLRHKHGSAPDTSSPAIPAALEQLALLEPVSQLARKLSQPLLAACAISRITELCLHFPEALTPDNGASVTNSAHTTADISAIRGYAHYGFIGYAWVASWFCGDYKLSREILQQGLALQQPVSGTTTGATPLHSGHAASATDLWHCSQIQHWLEPLSEVLQKLRKVGDQCRRRNDLLLSQEQRVLWYQLITLKGETTLSRIRQRCQQDIDNLKHAPTLLADQLRISGQLQADYLQGRALLPKKPVYETPHQATHLIRAALLLNKQSLWPSLYSWQAQLERDLPGYLVISDTLFCLTLMRLIQSQQEQQLSPRRARFVEQSESRFELWSQYCPENFSGQQHLLSAEKNRITSDKADNIAGQYEEAIRIFSANQLQVHLALAYERYADFLNGQHQNVLAELCLAKARKLYQGWGATAKVALLDEMLSA